MRPEVKGGPGRIALVAYGVGKAAAPAHHRHHDPAGFATGIAHDLDTGCSSTD